MACISTGMAMFNKLLVFDFDCPVWLDKPSISDFPKSPPSKFISPDIDLFLIRQMQYIKKILAKKLGFLEI
jgi:hypothetical protein